MSLRDLFAWPTALPILALAPLAWLALVVADRLRDRRVLRFAGRRAQALAPDLSRGERSMRRALLATGLMLALVAMLQPTWGADVRAAEPRGADLVVCLDVSRSMLAGDVPPSRLERAKLEIRALAEHAGGDRLALVAFAGEARLVVPLTSDVATFEELLDDVDPLTVERGGTDLAAAVAAGLEALPGGKEAGGAIVLVTDGEDLGGRGRRAAQASRERGVVLHCVGIGSTMGSKIPLDGGAGFLRDRDGRDVLSAMDAESLRAMASAAGGTFVDAASTDQPLVALRDRLRSEAAGALSIGERRERPNRFQWPLVAAVAAWLLERFLTDRRGR